MVSSVEPLPAWLRTGTAATERLDFPAGTARPDGRLDLCEQPAPHRLLDGARQAAIPTRFVLGKGVATSIKQRLDALSAQVPEKPETPRDVAAVQSVHRRPPLP